MSQASPPGDGAKRERATLTRDLGEFLIELSIGVHRYAMYPPGHPSLVSVAENIIARLADCFEDRRSLTIGIAQKQLVIEGVATDSSHPVLSDLARRLHDHQLGALSLKKGVVAREIEDLLKLLAEDSEDRDTPLGRLDAEEMPSWEHVSLHPLGYSKLQMKGDDALAEDEPDRVVELWLGLAQTAMSAEEPYTPSAAPDESVLADEIRSHGREQAYDQVIVGYLLQLAEELKGSSGGEADRIRLRVSKLIEELDEDTLARLVKMGGDHGRRRNFVLDANQSLSVDAVMKLLEAAASTSGESISSSMVRLLSKMSVHARQGEKRVRSQADTALRDNVEDLLDDWELENPNPDDYTQMLDGMARAAPILQDPEEAGDEGEGHPGAFRIVEMALEVDGWGPTVRSAVSELVGDGKVSRLLELVARVDDDSRTAREIRRYVTDPGQVRRFLSGEDVDEDSLETVVRQMGDAAVAPLLDALVESESRAVRRKVFDRLGKMDVDLSARIKERLEDERWYVVRNMLALIQRLDLPPEGFSPGRYLGHGDRRVRREAFPLALDDPASRERALATGLADEDERLVRMALLELQQRIPETLVPTLVNRVVHGDHPEGIRAMALRVLRNADSTLARDALIEEAGGGKTLFGRRKVAEKSPPVLAALESLAHRWAGHAAAADLLKAARAHGDPEIRRAATKAAGGNS